MLQPPAAVESPGEDDSADRPVCEHSDPDTHGAEAHDSDQKDAEAESASPHGAAGGDHGEFHISGCA